MCCLLQENDKSCLCEDCSRYNRPPKKLPTMLVGRQGVGQGRREAWMKGSWEDRLHKSLERTRSTKSGVGQEWKTGRNKVVSEGAWGIERLLILVIAKKNLGQVDDVRLWKKKNLGCGWNVGELGFWNADEDGATCSYVCVMEARSVKLKILVASWEARGTGQEWFLDAGIFQWPSERWMERGNVGPGKSWEGDGRTWVAATSKQEMSGWWINYKEELAMQRSASVRGQQQETTCSPPLPALAHTVMTWRRCVSMEADRAATCPTRPLPVCAGPESPTAQVGRGAQAWLRNERCLQLSSVQGYNLSWL